MVAGLGEFLLVGAISIALWTQARRSPLLFDEWLGRLRGLSVTTDSNSDANQHRGADSMPPGRAHLRRKLLLTGVATRITTRATLLSPVTNQST